MKDYKTFECEKKSEFITRINNQFDISNITNTGFFQGCLHSFFKKDAPYLIRLNTIRLDSSLSQLQKFGEVVALYNELKITDHTPEKHYWYNAIAREFQKIGSNIPANIVIRVENEAMKSLYKQNSHDTISAPTS
jgi:hypothetical protein